VSLAAGRSLGGTRLSLAATAATCESYTSFSAAAAAAAAGVSETSSRRISSARDEQTL